MERTIMIITKPIPPIIRIGIIMAMLNNPPTISASDLATLAIISPTESAIDLVLADADAFMSVDVSVAMDVWATAAVMVADTKFVS